MKKEKNTCHASEILLENSVVTENFGKGPKFGKRHGQLIYFFLMIFVGYLTRVMMSVTIVAMTDSNSGNHPEIPTYTWTNKSIILSAFFWGYVLPQVFAGWLANRYGPKWFVIVSTAIGSAVGLGIPFAAAHYGSHGVIACRAIQGLSQGFIYPSMHYLLSQWAPLSERSRFGFFVYGGSQVGTVMSMFFSGLLSSSQFGWPSVFYTFSGAGIIWCILFTLYGHNSPNEHPSITDDEKNYICSTTGVTSMKEKTTPWLKIFTSVPVWALILTQCGYVWTYDLMLTQVPNYMNKVLNFDMKKNTLLSPIPYLSFWILCFVMSFLSDFSINKKYFSIGTSRKVFSAIGFIVPALAMVVLGNCNSANPFIAFSFLVIAIGGSAAGKCGFFVNQLDIAPNHAGTLMGIVNGISNTFGILSTVACQYFVKDETDPNEWKIIFYMSAVINIVACFIFAIFGSGEIQPWNDTESSKNNEKDNDLVASRRFSVE